MNDKCEWKDRKYNPCKKAYNNYLDLGKPYGPFWNQEKQIFIEVYFCPWCGVDIRKPEPELTTEEKLAFFGKEMEKMGFSAPEFIESMNPEVSKKEQLLSGIIEGDKPWNDHLLFSIKEAVVYLLTEKKS